LFSLSHHPFFRLLVIDLLLSINLLLVLLILLILFLGRLVRYFFFSWSETNLGLRLVRNLISIVVKHLLFWCWLLLDFLKILFRLVVDFLFLVGLVGHLLDRSILWLWLILVVDFFLVFIRIIKKFLFPIAGVCHNRY